MRIIGLDQGTKTGYAVMEDGVIVESGVWNFTRTKDEHYGHMFNKIARHAHTDAPAVWQERLEQAGFDLEDTWDYFSPEALHILEWGHPLGLPALISKKLFGRWVLVPQRWNLSIPWKLTRKFMDNPRTEQGVCSFFIARRRS